MDSFAYISSSEKILTYTGNRESFFGKGGISNPRALEQVRLDNDLGIGKRSCMAIELEVEIESFSDKKISIMLGGDENINNAKNTAYKYSKVSNCNIELEKVKNKWKNLLGRVQVNTPYESLNIMLNGWTMYQTIASRLMGRSGFYQSGGAFGFRDQLQDTFSCKYLEKSFPFSLIME